MSHSIIPADSGAENPDPSSADVVQTGASRPEMGSKVSRPGELPNQDGDCQTTPAPQTAGVEVPESEKPVAAAEAVEPSILLAELQRQMNRLQREIRITIQLQLGQMTGRSLGSIQANRELARSIHEMLDAHGLRVRCPHCGNAAILRVSPRSGAAHGVFVFDHTIDGKRTFHGGRITVPEILLVAKPPRKVKKSAIT